LDGIISLRGRMVPVINGRRRLGHDLVLPDRKSRIIVLQEDNELQGILVDSASQVLKLPKKDIEPTPPVVVGIDAEFIDGVCQFKNQMIILLSLQKFLQIN
jgi:purine-binding chemotaxis protein CheW